MESSLAVSAMPRQIPRMATVEITADNFKETIEKAFPNKSDKEINEAIETCLEEIKPSEGRAKLTECVKKKLGG